MTDSNDRIPEPTEAELDEPSEGASFPIVGDGGLEAFTQLLRALPADTGMAFVLVRHLAAHPPQRAGGDSFPGHENASHGSTGRTDGRAEPRRRDPERIGRTSSRRVGQVAGGDRRVAARLRSNERANCRAGTDRVL